MTAPRALRAGVLLAGVLLAGVLLAGAATAGLPAAAVAQGPCPSPPRPASLIAEEPWAQARFWLDRRAPAPTGRGVTVAILDSGVDTRHPQLAGGEVVAGADLTPDGGTDGRVDCDGHGTAVASIIAATADERVDFAGLAPGATILPVRVTEQASDVIQPAAVADGIIEATDRGADVINLSLFFDGPDADLEEAVGYALARGVIVVAAVSQQSGGRDAPTAPSYPAGYDGVIGVGAIDRSGGRLAGTYTGPDIDLLAPGGAVTVAAAGGGHRTENGTSFAAAFVSAAAALVLAERGVDATGAVDLLRATADRAAAFPSEPDLAGIVNPYRALTGRVADRPPAAIPPPSRPPVDPVAQARADRWDLTVQRALVLVLFAVTLTLLGLTAGWVWRRAAAGAAEPPGVGRGAGASRGVAEPPGTARGRAGRRGQAPGQVPQSTVDDAEQAFYRVPDPRSQR